MRFNALIYSVVGHNVSHAQYVHIGVMSTTSRLISVDITESHLFSPGGSQWVVYMQAYFTNYCLKGNLVMSKIIKKDSFLLIQTAYFFSQYLL